MSLTRDEWRVLSCVDGRRSVSELARQLGEGEFRTCQVLHGLVTTGLLEVGEAGETAEVEPEVTEPEEEWWPEEPAAEVVALDEPAADEVDEVEMLEADIEPDPDDVEVEVEDDDDDDDAGDDIPVTGLEEEPELPSRPSELAELEAEAPPAVPGRVLQPDGGLGPYDDLDEDVPAQAPAVAPATPSSTIGSAALAQEFHKAVNGPAPDDVPAAAGVEAVPAGDNQGLNKTLILRLISGVRDL